LTVETSESELVTTSPISFNQLNSRASMNRHVEKPPIEVAAAIMLIKIHFKVMDNTPA